MRAEVASAWWNSTMDFSSSCDRSSIVSNVVLGGYTSAVVVSYNMYYNITVPHTKGYDTIISSSCARSVGPAGRRVEVVKVGVGLCKSGTS